MQLVEDVKANEMTGGVRERDGLVGEALGLGVSYLGKKGSCGR